MNIKDQICTLDQAKRLRELGITHEGYFLLNEKGEPFESWIVEGNEDRFYSAFTVAELGAMLPNNIVVESYRMHFHCIKQGQNESVPIYSVTYGKYEDNDVPVLDGHNEAELRAMLLIYLIENKLITHAEVNQRLNS